MHLTGSRRATLSHRPYSNHLLHFGLILRSRPLTSEETKHYYVTGKSGSGTRVSQPIKCPELLSIPQLVLVSFVLSIEYSGWRAWHSRGLLLASWITSLGFGNEIMFRTLTIFWTAASKWQGWRKLWSTLMAMPFGSSMLVVWRANEEMDPLFPECDQYIVCCGPEWIRSMPRWGSRCGLWRGTPPRLSFLLTSLVEPNAGCSAGVGYNM